MLYSQTGRLLYKSYPWNSTLFSVDVILTAPTIDIDPKHSSTSLLPLHDSY